MDEPLNAPQTKAIVIHKRQLPLLVVIITLASACIGGTGIYTGTMLGQHRSDVLLSSQRTDYENRLLGADKAHQAELGRVAEETHSLSLALGSLDKRVTATTEVAASGAATASTALAVANKAVTSHHDVTRAEFSALSAKTRAAQVDAQRSGIAAAAEHQQLASAVQENTVQTKALDAKMKTIERPPTIRWGGK